MYFHNFFSYLEEENESLSFRLQTKYIHKGGIPLMELREISMLE